jgi:hypothetical protein
MGPLRDIGSYIKPTKGIKVTNAAAGTINGAAIDRMAAGGRDAFMSCVLHGMCGDATGAPSARTVDFKLQDSDDGSTGWADITGSSVSQLTANDTDAEKGVNLGGAKRYIRAVAIVGFTGGTSPAIPVAADVVLGGAKELPA